MTGNWHFQLPPGVKDWLPAEAAALRKLEEELVTLFKGWGYREVLTPTFEFVETFTAGSPVGEESSLFKFIDRDGRVLALRPEMTAPIARLVATSLKREDAPLRLCYRAGVFRYEEVRAGRMREFHQAGVELIGAEGVAADAEIIALAVETLLKAGFKEFRLGLGQVAVTKGVLQDLALPREGVLRLKTALAGKDYVTLERLLDVYNLEGRQRRNLELLATLHGGKEALEEAGDNFDQPGAAAALEDLAQVWDALAACGLEKWLFIDLGILRDFDYYTGIVFEGYVPGLGMPVCGGGRYNELLGRFGLSCPATGFAVGLERVLTARGNREEESFAGKGYLVAGRNLGAVLRRAQELRREGMTVVIDGQSKDRQQATARAAARGLNLIWVEI